MSELAVAAWVFVAELVGMVVGWFLHKHRDEIADGLADLADRLGGRQP